jgi:hypothetical protein
METTFRYPVYHLILHWKRHLANPRRVDVSLPRVSFNSTLDSLPLQLCSQPLTGNSFAIDRLGTEPLPVSCALDLIPSSLFFGDDDYIGCLDGGVSVRARSADLGMAYLNLFPLTQHYSIYQPSTIESASCKESDAR